MERVKRLNRIAELLARFRVEVGILNANAQFDINIVSEDVVIPILNTLFLADFKNAKYEFDNNNFPGIDLIDVSKRLCFQITAQNSFAKVISTAEKIKKYNLYEEFDQFYMYILNGSLESYSEEKIEKIADGKFRLPRRNILDAGLLYKKISSLSLEQITAIEIFLEANFSDVKNFAIEEQFSSLLVNQSLSRSDGELDKLAEIRQKWIDKKLFLEMQMPIQYDQNQIFSINETLKDINVKIAEYSERILKLVN
jgi:hypothetical protein